jgi:hypothetical protein
MSGQTDAVRRMIQAYNTGNTDDVAEYIHPDYLNPAAMEHMDLRGPDSFAMAVKWLRMTFSEEARLEEVQLEERGEWVRAYLVLYGRHVGDLVGMAATGPGLLRRADPPDPLRRRQDPRPPGLAGLPGHVPAARLSVAAAARLEGLSRVPGHRSHRQGRP